MALSPSGRIRVNVTGARGALGIDLQGTLTPGQFLVKAPGGGRTFNTASGTGADAGLRTDLAADSGANNLGYVQSGDNAVPLNLLLKVRENVTVREYGANELGLRAAIKEIGQARSGGTLTLKTRSVDLSSAALNANGPILISEGTDIEGEGANFTVTGDAVTTHIFRVKDASNVKLRNIIAFGNLKGITDSSSGALLQVLHSANAQRDMENILIEDVRQSGFASERQISLIADHPDFRLLGARVKSVRVFSRQGESLAPNDINYAAAAVYAFGVGGKIVELKVEDLHVEGAYLKEALVLAGKIENARVIDLSAIDIGKEGAADDKGAYAVSVYGPPGSLKDIRIVRPYIIRPRSVGLYLRGCEGVSVADPTIRGQTDTNKDTLPKGAIVSNGSRNVAVTGGEIADCAIGVSVVGFTGESKDVNFEMNETEVVRSTFSSLILNPAGGSAGVSRNARFNGVAFTTVGGGARAVYAFNEIDPGRAWADVYFKGCMFRTAGPAIAELTVNGPSLTATNYNFDGCDLYVPTVGIRAVGIGSINVRYSRFHGVAGFEHDTAVKLDNAGSARLIGNDFQDAGAGYSYSAVNVQATIEGNLYRNVAGRAAPNSLGAAPRAPTDAGVEGQIVDIANPQPGGIAQQRYIAGAWRTTATVGS